MLAASALLAIGIALLAWWILARPLPQTAGSLRVSGLTAEVVVRRDPLGVPHITANSLPDLYFAQGYVTAQDRLWQMDGLRRLAGGTLSEVVGESGYRSDADRRMLGMARIATRAATTLPEQQRRLMESYAAGVNAFIRDNQGRLPMEFRMLRYQPAPWKVSDSVLVALQMFHVLTSTWRDELLKLLLLSKVGPERTAELLVVRSDRDHPPASELGGQVGRPVPAGSGSLPPAVAELVAGDDWVEPGGLPLDRFLRPNPGSNNWVISGTHSASGRAMLANDPHLQLSVPSIWYAVQLTAPGSNAAGVSLPGLPSIVIGHNQNIAWGITNLGADVQDLYIEKTDPKKHDMYMVDGQWQPMQVTTEHVPVHGGTDRLLEIRRTRHGPIVLNDRNTTYTMRWIATDEMPWDVPFFAVNAAHNWEEFRQALANFPGPTSNFVYADANGNIGYQAAGKVPVRARGDGSQPLPGEDSSNDWKGYIPFPEMASVYNPPTGMIATANARVVPDHYPYPVATKWEAPDRTERIYQLLGMQRKFRPEDFTRIQTDVYSRHYKIMAEAFAAALEHRRGDSRALRIAGLLRNWSGEVEKDLPQPAIVNAARSELLKKLLAPRIGPPYFAYRWNMSSVFLEQLLEHPRAEWLPKGQNDFYEVISECVEKAAEQLTAQFKTSDPEQWKWGRMTETVLAHPFANRIPRLLHGRFVIGPFPQDGNGYTVKQTTRDLGPSMRMVVDFADLDATLLTLTVGESGQVFSPHFGDQFDAWYSGRGLKFPFTPAAVERESKETLRLTP